MGKNNQRQLLERCIVTDPKICYGKPTFHGTRVMVWQVIEMIAEAVRQSGRLLNEQSKEFFKFISWV